MKLFWEPNKFWPAAFVNTNSNMLRWDTRHNPWYLRLNCWPVRWSGRKTERLSVSLVEFTIQGMIVIFQCIAMWSIVIICCLNYNSHSPEEFSLRVRAVSTEDLGNYTCSLKVSGRQVESATLLLDTLPPPPVFVRLRDGLNETEQLLSWTGNYWDAEIFNS